MTTEPRRHEDHEVTRRSWRVWGALVCVAALGVAAPVWGQAGGAAPAWPPREAGKWTVSAKPLEKPDLAYVLLPMLQDLSKGNAAVKYQAAVGETPGATDDSGTLIRDAMAARLETLDPEDARLRPVLEKYDRALRNMHDGARLDRVDWEVQIRTQGVAALIPGLPKLREDLRALTVEIRLDIKRHNWSAAQDKLQTGFALARHMGQGDTIIESLVGLAMAGQLATTLEDWVSEPGAPNLYWPLSNLPAPFNDMRRPMMNERAFVFFSLPDLKKMHDGQYSAEIWNNAVAQFAHIEGPGPEPWQRELAGPALGVAMYPEAKRFLRERGMSAEAVERMPVAEALGRYFMRSFDEAEDDVFKWMGLPPAQAVPGLKQAYEDFAHNRQANKVNILASIMLPSLSKAVENSMKIDRQIAVLRTVEALRAYAAEQGQFPDALEALKVPVPTDPSGKPFGYERNGNTVTITTSPLDFQNVTRYEVTLRK